MGGGLEASPPSFWIERFGFGVSLTNCSHPSGLMRQDTGKGGEQAGDQSGDKGLEPREKRREEEWKEKWVRKNAGRRCWKTAEDSMGKRCREREAWAAKEDGFVGRSGACWELTGGTASGWVWREGRRGGSQGLGAGARRTRKEAGLAGAHGAQPSRAPEPAQPRRTPDVRGRSPGEAGPRPIS